MFLVAAMQSNPSYARNDQNIACHNLLESKDFVEIKQGKRLLSAACLLA
jgi:hypothetical protein